MDLRRVRGLLAALGVALFTAGPAGTAGVVGAQAGLTLSHAPRIALKPPSSGHGGGGGTSSTYGWASSNWSGYALTSSTAGTYTSVSGAWTVPTVAPSKGPTYSASWVGIDGFNNSDLIQTGTEQDYTNGSAQYYAWWEILPAPETVISGMTIHPGDRMTASVVKGSGGQWTITLTDTTTGQTFSTTQNYSGPQTSAEWIEEAPTVGGHVATLADYGATTFDPGTVNGVDPGLVAQDGGIMIQKNRQVSTPSGPDSDTDGFNVAYGSAAPAPPPS